MYSIFRLEIKIGTVIDTNGHNVKHINRKHVETFYFEKWKDDVKKYKQRNFVIAFS